MITVVLAAAMAAGLAACGAQELINISSKTSENEFALESASALTADLDSTDLRITLGDENKIHYKVPELLEPVVTQENGTLTLTNKKQKPGTIINATSENYIEITLDSKALGDVDIDLDSGNVSFDGFDIGGSITTDSGDIKIKNAENGGDIVLKADSGNVTVSNGSFASVSKETDSGDACFENVNAGSFLLRSDSGSTKLTGAEPCDIDHVSDSGSLTIELNGDSGLGFDISSGSGSITVGENKCSGSYVRDGGSSTIKAKTDSGSVTVSFR